MPEEQRLLVLCVDRDDDLGRKAGVQGPVIGEKDLLKAASKLALADPGESDANCLFAGIKRFQQLKKEYSNLEIAAVTGSNKSEFSADKIVNEQLDAVLKNFPAENFVLVTDGAEDDQIIPILQSRGKIISKETVIIKQAQAVESTYYTIKEALKDPFLSRIVFGIPGLILLLYFALGTLSFQIIALVLGAYLLLKGFGIEDYLIRYFRKLASSFSIQRTSFPFYIGGFFVIAFGAITAWNSFSASAVSDFLIRTAGALQTAYFFFAVAGISIVVGRAIDTIHFKKAYLLGKHFLTAVSILLFWFILDTGTAVILKLADLNLFLTSMLVSFIVLLVVFRIAEFMDLRKRITRLLVGLPVYSQEGKLLGKVKKTNKNRNLVIYSKEEGKEDHIMRNRHFTLRDNRLVKKSIS